MSPHVEKDIVAGLGIGIASIVLSLWVAAFVVRRLPVDYLVAGRRPAHVRPRWQQLVLATGQNAVAVVLIAAGVIMSVPGVPGQGILTILVGVLLLQFPGKLRLERWIFSHRRAFEALNRFRTWLRCPPLVPPSDERRHEIRVS